MKLPSHFVTNATTVASDFTMTRSKSLANFGKTLSMLAITLTLSLGLTGCEYFQTQTDANSPIGANQIAKLIPKRGQDSKSWAQDINQIFDTLKIEKNAQNICTAVAIIDQESNFKANPPVANLGQSSLKAMNEELEEKLGSTLAPYFRTMLKTEPTPDNSFEKQIAKVKTEEELDDIYHQMFAYFSSKYYASKLNSVTKLVGGDIEEKLDPITTLGSMQVQVSYARDHRRMNGNNLELRKDLYSQYGGLYYGIHRLLLYKANYQDPIYRFADYNSGMYSSRNAAFQKMAEKISGTDLDLDGDLLSYDKNGDPRPAMTTTEKALTNLFAKNNILVTPRQLRDDLKKEKDKSFEKTQTYIAISKLYQEKTGKDAPYAIMPEVVISGPKLSRDYNTNWYASRVNGRYETCMQRAKRIKI